jgi:hypothetical protein
MRILAAAIVAGLLATQARAADIRLKHRTIRAPAGLERIARPLPASRPGHYIVQFASYPGPDVRQELARRQIRVLQYVPDSALLVAGSGMDLDGLDVTWAGPLEADDKLSPLAAEAGSAYLVFLHPDVDAAAFRQAAVTLGFELLENPSLLPGNLLVSGAYSRLRNLAALDEVSYIMPASPELAAGTGEIGCAGPIAEAGPIGEYVEVSRGWAKDPSGTAPLQYVIGLLTNKLDESTVRLEIERALREWTRYARVTLAVGQREDAVRTIAVKFARASHGDAYPFDGPGGVLAHTFYPSPPNTEPVAGDMHLDADENWHAGANMDLFSVVLHEAGHALGLGHSDRPGAVMYPYYHMVVGLTDDDIAGIRDLYGSNVPSAVPVPPPVAPPVAPPVPPPVAPPVPPPVTPPVTPPPQPPSKRDTTAPGLTILSPGSSIISTSAASIVISGTAKDDTAVTAVKWITSTGGSGIASGTASWSVTVPLLVGTSTVTLRAYDAAGNSSWRAITVVRR